MEAIELFEHAIRLSPKHPFWVPRGFGLALHLTGRKEEALQWLQKAKALRPEHASVDVYLVALYVDLGRMDDARAAADELLRLKPRFTVDQFLKGGYSFQDPERNDWLRDLLLEAGLPE